MYRNHCKCRGFEQLERRDLLSVAPLLPADVQLNNSSAPIGQVEVAFDGSHYLTVWAQAPSTGALPSVFGRFVDTAGGFVGEPFQISQFPLDELEPDVAFNGSEYLVVWRDILGVKARLVGTDGTLNSFVLVVSTENHQKLEPAVASDGSQFMVVWRDSRNYDFGDFSDINGQIIEVAPTGNAILTGQNFVIGPVAGHQFAPSIAFGSTGPGSDGYLVSWTEDIDETAGEFDVYGAVVDAAGIVSDEFAVAAGPGPQGNQRPAETAFDGTNFLVVYHDGNEGGLYGSRVSLAGAVLDSPGFVISDTCSPCTNDVAFGGGEYLVTFDGGARIRGARVTPAGDVLDPTAVDLALSDVDQRFPAVAYGSGNFLVAWEAGGLNDKFMQLIGPSTPAAALEDLSDSVQTLIDTTVIDDRAGRVLLRSLDIAQRLVEQDRPRAAILTLRVFNIQVRLFHRFGLLADAETEALLNSSIAIIVQLRQ